MQQIETILWNAFLQTQVKVQFRTEELLCSRTTFQR